MKRWIRALIIPFSIIGITSLLLLPGLANSAALSGTDAGTGFSIVNGPTITPTFCPQPTQEPFWVDPVISPSDVLTQTILVYIGKGDWARVSLETGVYTKTGTINLSIPAAIVVDLDPNTTHHLTAAAHVPVVTWPGGCQFGGYTLSASVDKNGNPLTIIQVSNRNYFPSAHKD